MRKKLLIAGWVVSLIITWALTFIVVRTNDMEVIKRVISYYAADIAFLKQQVNNCTARGNVDLHEIKPDYDPWDKKDIQIKR